MRRRRPHEFHKPAMASGVHLICRGRARPLFPLMPPIRELAHGDQMARAGVFRHIQRIARCGIVQIQRDPPGTPCGLPPPLLVVTARYCLPPAINVTGKPNESNSRCRLGYRKGSGDDLDSAPTTLRPVLQGRSFPSLGRVSASSCGRIIALDLHQRFIASAYGPAQPWGNGSLLLAPGNSHPLAKRAIAGREGKVNETESFS
jgi:hypothetical protein